MEGKPLFLHSSESACNSLSVFYTFNEKKTSLSKRVRRVKGSKITPKRVKTTPKRVKITLPRYEFN